MKENENMVLKVDVSTNWGYNAGEMDTTQAAGLHSHFLPNSLCGFPTARQQPTQTQCAPGSVTRCGAPSPRQPPESHPGRRRTGAAAGQQHPEQPWHPWVKRTPGDPTEAEAEAGGHLYRRENHRQVPQDATWAPSTDVDLQNQRARESLTNTHTHTPGNPDRNPVKSVKIIERVFDGDLVSKWRKVGLQLPWL